MLKKAPMALLLAALSTAGLSLSPTASHAAADWTVLKSIDLDAAPLDVAPSPDGRWLFILTPGELEGYSVRDGRVTVRMPVEKGFDRVASLPMPNGLALSSSAKKTVRIVMIEPVYEVDVSGLPFEGPSDAPVTIAVFDDYQ